MFMFMRERDLSLYMHIKERVLPLPLPLPQNIKNIKPLRFMAKNQIKYLLIARKSSLEPLGLPSG